MKNSASSLVEIVLYFAIVGTFMFAAMTFALQVLTVNSVSTNVSELQNSWNQVSQKIISSIQLARAIDTDNSTFDSDTGVLTLFVPIQYNGDAEYTNLATEWSQHLNGNASSQWTITNPNSVPLQSVPNIKIRYNWYAYSGPDLTGSIVSQQLGSDSPNPNPVNTGYAQSLLVEWYIEDDGENTGVLGCTYANSDGIPKSRACYSDTWATSFALDGGDIFMTLDGGDPIQLNSPAVQYDKFRFQHVTFNKAPDQLVLDIDVSPDMVDLANLKGAQSYHTAVSLRPY